MGGVEGIGTRFEGFKIFYWAAEERGWTPMKTDWGAMGIRGEGQKLLWRRGRRT